MESLMSLMTDLVLPMLLIGVIFMPAVLLARSKAMGLRSRVDALRSTEEATSGLLLRYGLAQSMLALVLVTGGSASLMMLESLAYRDWKEDSGYFFVTLLLLLITSAILLLGLLIAASSAVRTVARREWVNLATSLLMLLLTVLLSWAVADVVWNGLFIEEPLTIIDLGTVT